jgi:PKD repeat protein
VTFTAAVNGGSAASKPYKYSWTFGDDATGTGATVNHTYAKTGTYDAQVAVTGADGSAGVSSQVVVTVGPPKKKQHPGGGSGQPHPGGPATGAGPGPGKSGHHGKSGHRVHHHKASPDHHIIGIDLPPLPHGLRKATTTIHNQPPTQSSPLLADSLPVVSGRTVSPGMTLSAAQTAIAATTAAATASAGSSSLRLGGGLAIIAGAVALLALGMLRELRGHLHHSEPTA